MNDIDKLAEALEEPRAIRLLAERLAIEHDKTALQYAEHMEDAQELYEFLAVIVFREQFRRAELYPEMLEMLKDANWIIAVMRGGSEGKRKEIADFIAKCEEGATDE